MSDAKSQYMDLYNRFVQLGKEPSFEFRMKAVLTGSLKDFDDYCCAPSEYREDAIAAMIQSLLEFDVFKACVMSVLVGSYVEAGYEDEKLDTVITFCNKLTDLCLDFVAALCDSVGITTDDFEVEKFAEVFHSRNQEELMSIHPDGYRAFLGSNLAIPGIMAVICKSQRRRDALRGRTEDFMILSELLEKFDFLVRVMTMCEEKKIIVINPATKSGVEIIAKEIENNFNLFSLLQLCLYQSGFLDAIGAKYAYNEEIDKLAHNLFEGEKPEVSSDNAVLQYYTYLALQADGSFKTKEGGQVYEMGMIWGEGNIAEIPEFCGDTVILVDKNILYNRSWADGFLTPVHYSIRPSLEIVRNLEVSETEDLLKRIVAENEGNRKASKDA